MLNIFSCINWPFLWINAIQILWWVLNWVIFLFNDCTTLYLLYFIYNVLEGRGKVRGCLWELVLSFKCVGSRDVAQSIRIGWMQAHLSAELPSWLIVLFKICYYLCECMCHSMHVEGRGRICGVASRLLTFHGLWGSNLLGLLIKSFAVWAISPTLELYFFLGLVRICCLF